MIAYIYPNEAEMPWSILIVLYPFITGLVAGAFVVSSLYHVFGMKALKPVARLALITALAFLLIAPLPLQAHLGHPERAFLIFLTPHFTSAMAGFGYIWMAYLILVVVETWLVFRADIVALAQRSHWPMKAVYNAMALGVDDVSEEAMAADHKLIKILAAVGIPAAAMLHGYVGFIFGAVKANPWWSTPLMPIIFLLSAIVSGIAFLMVLYVVAMKLLERDIDHDCVRAMASLLAGFLFIDLTLEGLELLSMAYEQEESWGVVSGLMERIAVSFFVVQILIGGVLPLIILGFISLARIDRRVSTAISTVTGVFVVIGVFMMRWNVVVGGQTISKSFRGYVPYEWIFGGREGVFMAALILCLPLALFTVLVTLLPPWVEAEPAAVGAVEADQRASVRQPASVPVFSFAGAAAGTGGSLKFGDRGYSLSGLPAGRRRKRYLGLKLALTGLAAVMGALFFGVLFAPGSPRLWQLGGSQPSPVLVPQVRTVFPAQTVATFTQPAGGSWVEPLDITVMGDRIFVLDHSGQQVIEMDTQGKFVRSYDATSVPGLELRHPHTMDNDGTNVYIGNTFPPTVYVLDPRTGTLKRSIPLPPGDGADGLPAVPTGMAFTPQGNILVSDGQNHRLLVLTPDGALVQVVSRQAGSWDLITPNSAGGVPATSAGNPLSVVATVGRPGSVGVAIDGTVLALDVLGPGVIRVNADGNFIGSFARPDDPAGGIFRPTDIAVDSRGLIYVSDDLIGGIQVYGKDGSPLGLIGRVDPNSFTTPSDIKHPSALAIQNDRLYVVDRGRGVVVYQLPGVLAGVLPPAGN
jgi:predicted membrane protein/outer membrane protein assembly factor BamB